MTGLGTGLAGIVQIGFAILAAAIVAIGCARGPMSDYRMALFLACSVFATPYLLSHDLVAASAAMAMLAATPSPGRSQDLAVKAMYLLPMLQMAAGIWHIPGVALIPVWFAFWVLRRLRSNPEAVPPASTAA
ncbi:MAG: hypothetical protein ACRECE_03100 [Xanthobacteraceae bacterium]